MRRVINSPVGPVTLYADNKGVTGLFFGDISHKDGYFCEDNKGDKYNASKFLDLCEKELNAYFAGKLRQFTVPVKAKGTPFRERVWDELCQIPYGETASYKDIAERIGNPKAVRAVGGANHNNPISIIIPCHRVIGASGSLTGYGGGLEAKKLLLELEANNK